MTTPPFPKPHDIFARDREWSDLADFATSPDPGLRLAIVRGRLRQGKSFLLRRLVRACSGFYYQALEEERTQALESLAVALGRHLAVPGGRLAFASWAEAVEALADLRGAEGRPALVVIDELPYLLAHSPELPSVIQRAVDERRGSSCPPARLILCGSALAVMSDLLAGSRALRGRATLDLVMHAFDYRDAARFWGIGDPRVAFTAFAVFGGTPGYRDLLTAAAPKSLSSFGRWLAKGPLNPSSALFREDDYLLTGEPALSGRALYHAVLTAIAQGKTTQGAIAAALGREQRAVQYPLAALTETGFVIRDDDLLRKRRPSYRLADPILRFHHAVTRPDLARFEDHRTAEAWSDAGDRFRSQVLGPQFEQVARDFTSRYASAAALGGVASRVGRAVVNDPGAHTTHEIDVVAIDTRTRGRRPRIVVLGEAKYTERPLTLEDVRRLERVRGLIATRRDVEATSARLALYSASGFDAQVAALPHLRDDVLLFGLQEIYGTP
jgi:AAA+ ATPase superfamily predicted ATPase